MNLFLDDKRSPIGSDWNIVRNFSEAQKAVIGIGLNKLERVSFDHDLGLADERTGYDFAKWLCETTLNGIEQGNTSLCLPETFIYRVHSANTTGKRNIRMYLRGFAQTMGFGWTDESDGSL